MYYVHLVRNVNRFDGIPSALGNFRFLHDFEGAVCLYIYLHMRVCRWRSDFVIDGFSYNRRGKTSFLIIINPKTDLYSSDTLRTILDVQKYPLDIHRQYNVRIMFVQCRSIIPKCFRKIKTTTEFAVVIRNE